jgi:DNA sulfur modification protein DndB
MKIPAIRASIGEQTYYVTTLTFEQVQTYVSRIDDELHKSESLKDAIQRSITTNYLRLKEYILNQKELFFNSLVLAVYDDYPKWEELEVNVDGETYYQIGLLDFPGKHKIFPVDGQHRVEGIKEALKANPSIKDYRIGVVFIGHKNDDAGKQKTRRLFTTLNRYAKPVSLDDIIALDEDDSVAIITRSLLEEYDLFTGKRVVLAKQKAIAVSNKDAITSLITLYQANTLLFKYFYENNNNKKVTPKLLAQLLKFRPEKKEIDAFEVFCREFWDSFKTNFDVVKDFLSKGENAAIPYRDNEIGGNLIFRPISFKPLIQAAIAINSKKTISFDDIFKKYNSINLSIDSKPWANILWNPIEKKMKSPSSQLVYLLLMYVFDPTLLNDKELKKMKEAYAAELNIEIQDVDSALAEIK